MKTDRGTWALRLAAGAVLAAGLLLSVQTVASLPGRASRMAQKSADLDRLRELAAGERGAHEVLAALHRLPVPQAPDIGSLLVDALPGVTPDIRERERQDTGAGLVVRRVDVALDDAPLAGLGTLLNQALQARPPWSPAECTIDVSATDPGRGRITLLFESLEPPTP